MSEPHTPDEPVNVENAGGATTAVAPTKKPVPTKREPGKLPPFKVLLHNDDVNTFEHVIVSIVRLARLETQEAMTRALEAHEAGVSLLLVTHQERAELIQDQFTSVGITVTIEPDGK